MKSSTLVSVITVQDLMFQSQKIVNIWYEPIEILTATAAIYIAFIFVVSMAGKLSPTGCDGVTGWQRRELVPAPGVETRAPCGSGICRPVCQLPRGAPLGHRAARRRGQGRAVTSGAHSNRRRGTCARTSSCSGGPDSSQL